MTTSTLNDWRLPMYVRPFFAPGDSVKDRTAWANPLNRGVGVVKAITDDGFALVAWPTPGEPRLIAIDRLVAV